MNKIGYISLSDNIYGNPVFLVVASMCGWIYVYCLSVLISKTFYFKKIMLFIGKSTIYIVLFHFLALKIVALIIIRSRKIPLLYMAAFPNLYGSDSMWWVVYSLVGLCLPLLLKVAVVYIRCGMKAR